MAIKRHLKRTPFYVFLKRYRNYSPTQLKEFVLNHYGVDGSKRLLRSIRNSFLLFGIKYSDYWKMRFEESTCREINAFVPRSAELNLYWQVNPFEKYAALLENKSLCYDFFHDFYKRELLAVNKDEISDVRALKKVLSFVERHSRFIVKPINGNCGKGVKIFETSNGDNGVEELFKDYKNGFVLEELIIQDESMSCLHPNSVNTVRIVTVNFGDEIRTLWPCLRIGKGDSIVDNGAAGGIITAIDVRTGKTFVAGDESRNKFVTHPDTKKSLIGFQIPFWEELCQLTKSMASRIPDCHIMGWDMAYSDKGWVLVECNYGPNLIFQYAAGGVRKEFEFVRKKLGAKRYKKYTQEWQYRPI